MNLVIYARISSIKQSENSIEAQLRVCRAWAQANGHTVAAEYVDMAQSAKNSDRDEFQAMIKAVLGGQADGILVHKLDRFARNRADSITYKTLLRRKGKDVISVSQPMGDSPTDRLLEGILETIDEFYLLNLASETQKGLRNLAVNGIFPQHPPLGYYRENRISYPDPVRWPMMKQIFEAYAGGGYTLKRLAKTAFENGLTSNTGKKVQPNHWQKLMRNVFYIGQVHWRGEIFPGKHQPLIDPATFNRIQELMTEKSRGGSLTRHQYKYSGLFVSERCGKKMIGTTVRNRFIYYRAKAETGPEHNIGEKTAEKILEKVLDQIVIAEPDIIPVPPALVWAVRLAPTAGAIYSYMSGEERNEFLELVVDQIIVDGENRLVEVKTKNGFKFNQ